MVRRLFLLLFSTRIFVVSLPILASMMLFVSDLPCSINPKLVCRVSVLIPSANGLGYRGLRHWRRQYSDEHPGTVYRVAIRVARTGGESQ